MILAHLMLLLGRNITRKKEANMYKAVNTDDVFNAVDGNRNKTMMSTPKATMVNTPSVSQNGNASEAEKIRAMGDRLAKIWED
jgi:hypothetical protein